MQEPELLLVDEPVAGMTPQETERTADLLLSLAGKHSVVVVEHDMEFVRSIAGRVTVLHEGSVLAEGDMNQVQNDPRVIEVYLGVMSLLAIKGVNQSYGGSHILWDVDFDVPAGSRMCLMGRNGMGKTTLLKCIMGLLPVTSGQLMFEGIDLRTMPTGGAGAARHRLRAAGARDLSAAHGRGEPSHRPRHAPERTHDRSAAHLRAVSGAQADAESARRQSLRRPAAAAGDRPCDGARAEAAHPRRADRRHSAEHRSRNRRHHPASQSRDRRDGAAGRAEAAVCTPRGQRVRHPRKGTLRRWWYASTT